MKALVDAFNQEILRDFPVIVKSSRTFISRSIDRTVRKNGEGVKRRIKKRKRHSSYFAGISKWSILSTLHIHWISIISLLSIYGDMENIISLDWARLSVLWTVITSTPCPLCVRAPARAQPCALYREPQYFYSKSEKLKGLTQERIK